MESNERPELAKLAVVLAACLNENTAPHARRLARVKYGLDFYEVELEAAAAELAADALRKLARAKLIPSEGGDRG
jgi:hypothetical protein